RVARQYHNRDFSCGLLRRERTRGVERNDEINLEPDKFGRKLRKSIQLAFRGAKFECNVLPLDIAKFTQSLPKFLLEGLRAREAYVGRAYSGHLSRWCARGEWPRRRAADHRHDLPPPHGLSPAPRSARKV